MQQNPLMLDLDAERELRLRETVLKELYNLITKEYGDQEEESGKHVFGAEAGQAMPLTLASAPSLSVNVLPLKSFSAPLILKSTFASGEGRPERSVEEWKTNVKDIQKQLDTVLRTSVAALKTKQQIEPVNLMVGSGGLYLDASVGALPSTEPYSEEMRKREMRMRDAEIFAARSKGVLQQAQASQITAGTFLTSIHPDKENLKRLTLGLNTFIEPGDWQLQVDGEVKGKVSEEQAVNMIGFTWKDKQEWRTMKDLKVHIELYNPESSQVIRFLMAESTEKVG